MPQKHRTMTGGFWDSLTSAWESTKKSATGAWEDTGKAVTSAYSSNTGSNTNSYTPSMGGRRKRSRQMRGGYSDNIALTGLSASASPIDDVKTAQPQTTVGGKRSKTKKRHRNHKNKKSRRR